MDPIEFEQRWRMLLVEADHAVAVERFDREAAYDADHRAELAYRKAKRHHGSPSAAEVLEAGGLDPGLLLPRYPGSLPDLRATGGS